MRRILLVAVILSNITIFAQNGSDSLSSNSYRKEQMEFKIRVGRATPQDEFGEKYRESTQSALAENGVNIGVSFFYPLTRYVDLSAELSNSTYNASDKEVKGYLDTAAADFNWDISIGSYNVRNAMIGVRLYAGNKFRAFINPSIGFSWISFPTILYEGIRVEDDKSVTEAYSKQNIEGSRNFTVFFSAGFDYFITDNFGLNFTWETISYDVTTPSNIDFLSVDGERGLVRGDVKTDYQTQNFTFGLVFKLQ